MYNLPKDLAEEVLSRVPITSMRKVRLTCKKWNTLSKGRNFAKKHLDRATSNKCMVVMMIHNNLSLMNIHFSDNVESSCIQYEGELISLDNSYEANIVNVLHCDGLLLCITSEYTKLVIWNPYWGQNRCLEPTPALHRLDRCLHAIGYDKSNHNYKILTFSECTDKTPFFEIKIYDLNSDSWRVLDVPPPEGHLRYYYRGVSINGDTYWLVKDKLSQIDYYTFFVSFDFTKERFGPLLPLPFDYFHECTTTTLSSVREEKLAVMVQRWDTYTLEIWITTKIEPNAVSWNNKLFLEVHMNIFSYIPYVRASFFFIDEGKKVAVVFDKDKRFPRDEGLAYIIGVDGSLQEIYHKKPLDIHCFPLVYSYVPSLVQLN